MNKTVLKMSDFVGKGYDAFWKFKGRYRIVKGSRASKKSKTASLWFISNLSKKKYEQANLLVIRKTFRTLKDSCFADLKWAINRFGLQNVWIPKESPLEIINRETGQKIIFRGLDDPLKVTSITVDVGFLCWLWIEEAYEIMSESDFDTIDESIRGEVPDPLFKQVTMTFNPWNEHHWIKKRFFDAEPDPDILAMTTNYLCNEWLDEADKKVFERMKKQNPRRYQVAGLGDWGIVDGLVYENWKEEHFSLAEIQKQYPELKSGFGLDYGFTNDPSAAFVGFVDIKSKIIFVWDEMYEKGLSNKKIYNNIVSMGYGKDKWTAESAEPKSNAELQSYGLRVKGAEKGKDSVNNGIQWIQDCTIIIHPRCVNFLTEISNYTWKKDKFGKKLNVPIDDFNHLMDAMRYGFEQYIINNQWLY